MKNEKLSEMIVRARRVHPGERNTNQAPGLPTGLAREIVRSNRPEASSRLLQFQNWSYAGLGVAATISLSILFLHRSPEITQPDPTGPWMEMPMSESELI